MQIKWKFPTHTHKNSLYFIVSWNVKRFPCGNSSEKYILFRQWDWLWIDCSDVERFPIDDEHTILKHTVNGGVRFVSLGKICIADRFSLGRPFVCVCVWVVFLSHCFHLVHFDRLDLIYYSMFFHNFRIDTKHTQTG